MGTAADPFGCVENTIKLRSGRYLDLRNPRPDQFTLSDIAGGLSKICRFGGQIPAFYSVAEHCVHCAEQAARDGLNSLVQRIALLHDAAEAFIGDVVKPLKIMLPEYAAVERRMETVIAAKYGLFGETPSVSTACWDAAREIDRAMLIAERRAMFGVDGVVWFGEALVRRLERTFWQWPPPRAEAEFLEAARKLGLTDPLA